jgi:uncharacterized protein (DUF2062 family)
MYIKRAIRYWIIRVKRLNGDPHYVAAGIATGIFVGITPTIPFHTALAIAIAFLLRGSKVAAVLGVWCGNPLTVPFFYYWSYKIGVFVMGDPNHYNLKTFNFLELWQNGHDIAIKMLLGGAILAVLPAVISYMITLRIMIIRKRRKRKRLARETTE